MDVGLTEISGILEPVLLVWAGVIAGVVELAIRGGRLARRDGWMLAMALGLGIGVTIAIRTDGPGAPLGHAIADGALDGVVLGLLSSGLYSHVRSLVEAAPVELVETRPNPPAEEQR